MKRLCNILAVVLFMLSLTGCYEDKGNYDYDWITRAYVVNLASKYTHRLGDTLVLTPEIDYYALENGTYKVAKEDVFSKDEYAYCWIAKRYDRTQNAILVDTIGREKDLNYIVALSPEEYFVEYQICNKTRDLSWLSKFTLNVTASAPEGWLLLEDNQGQAELSIYARMGDGSMALVKNVLSNSGIPAASLGAPRQVFATYQNTVGNGVWVLTDHFSGYLNVKEGHKWTSRQTIQNHIVETPGSDFVLSKMLNVMYYTVFAFSEDGCRVSRYPGMLFTADLQPLGDKRFEIAPYAGATGNESSTRQVLFFDKTNQRFKLLDVSGSFTWIDTDEKFPVGYDLMLMQTLGESGSEKICCLLKKDDGVYQMVASSSTQVETGAKLLSNSDKFLNAEQVVFHQVSKLPYYLYDGKLYVNRMAGDDREVEYYKLQVEEGDETEGEPEYTVVPAELEGRIVYMTTLAFSDLHIAGNEYRRTFMNYLVVTTELADGAGRVYFMTPEQANAQKLTINKVVETEHKVVSIDYQRPGI